MTTCPVPAPPHVPWLHLVVESEADWLRHTGKPLAPHLYPELPALDPLTSHQWLRQPRASLASRPGTIAQLTFSLYYLPPYHTKYRPRPGLDHTQLVLAQHLRQTHTAHHLLLKRITWLPATTIHALGVALTVPTGLQQ